MPTSGYVRVFTPGEIAVWIDRQRAFKPLVLERERSGKLVVLVQVRVRRIWPSDLRHVEEIVSAVMAA